MTNFEKVKQFMTTFGQEVKENAEFPDKKIREELGISDTLIRLSVGIEDVNDLKRSLDNALSLI